MLSPRLDSESIKIVHVLHSFEIGGLENGVVNLINGLDWNRYTHTICCITRSGRLVQRLKRKDVQIIEMGKANGSDFSLPFRLARVFARLKPSIVHTRNWGTVDGIIGARLGRVPVVVHGEHGFTMSEVNGNNRKRALVRRALSVLVDRFVIVSGAQRGWIEGRIGINGGKITTICNGVNLERFNCSGSKAVTRPVYHLEPEDFVVGTVGRLDPIKDQASLIRAFSSLAHAFPHARLLIVGSGPCREQLEDLARKARLERVVFLDEQDDVSRLFHCMDLFVLPSISEGISNTILEAMASGLPVIATAVGGNPELVRDRETGILVSKQNIPALTEAIRLYLENPSLATLHGNAGRRRVQEDFSLPKMVAAYDKLYTSLVHR